MADLVGAPTKLPNAEPLKAPIAVGLSITYYS